MLSQVCLCCLFFSRGFYSCRWTESSNHRRKCRWLSLLVVTLMSLLSLCWLYVCFAISNDQQNFNNVTFSILKTWVNYFLVLVIISAVLASYCILLLLFALIQVALEEQLHLHWLHKATAPFLQFGAVGALTLLSPFVFHRFHLAKTRSKMVIAGMFLVVSAAIFLCPLLIHSPCLIEVQELPEKPKLIGHTGAPMLAPENTMMSFNRSLECGVIAFETDVQLSKDRTPFLMHDHGPDFLLRTTNVKDKFKDSVNKSTDLTFEQLKTLNAGEQFLKNDPYGTVSLLSEEEKETARKQTILSLLKLLEFAKQHNTSVIFDLKNTETEEIDTNDTVKIILESGIPQSLILWLPSKEREVVKKHAPDFIQVYENETDLEKNNGSHLNVKYSKIKMKNISDLRKRNITVNLFVVNERWLFSMLWCAGASSVTTNACHLLKEMERPDWVMPRSTYLITWILVDISSALVMMALFHWTKHSLCHNADGLSNDNEQEVFLTRLA
ncbi:glycerophosphoinositol inositolphosphodiesterase GDPD2 isoform X2 [Pelmatolapia mariae]|uniref:glycerophosphoinositol inositolphosphodiesterase GDPD2 isoform X2 n=1 Tax=Pelmatolapia mariae TaxID=158779 RepID=UPI002FE63B16